MIAPQIYTAKVMHKRLFPKENVFSYGVYYLVLPLPADPVPGFVTGFHAKDVGRRDGSDPLPWVREILADYGINENVTCIILVTMPRVFGYVFNPVSFYLCLDGVGALRVVVCEVHNTFGEQHRYVCANPDGSAITPDSFLRAEKVFHVSPFLDRSGHYRFRFDLKKDTLGIWIDYYDAQQKKQVITSLMGAFSPLTPGALRRAFWRHPLVPLKSICLIHWQALKLVTKGIRYILKPRPMAQKNTATHGIVLDRNKSKGQGRKTLL